MNNSNVVINVRTYWLLTVYFLLAVFWVSACTSTAPTEEITPASVGSVEETPVPAGSCALNLLPEASDEEQIKQILQAEGELVVQQEIDLLMRLWNNGAAIVDAKHTAAETDDDQQWLDKDAIRHRYVRTVFPGAPSVVSPKDLAIIIIGQTATVTATTQIGTEVSPGGDRWQLSKVGDCWFIDRLTYNLESQSD